MSSQIFRCTEALFENSEALSNCIFDKKLYEHFNSFNLTNCISKVESFSESVDYICTFYYLNIFNSTESTTSPECVQFYYSGKELFKPNPCFLFNEEFENLFKVSTDPIEITFSILFLLFYIYYEAKYRPSVEEQNS